MSEIQQRMDEAGEAISEENEDLADMIHALTRRVSILEHQLQVVTEQNVNIEKELHYWRRIHNPRSPEPLQQENIGGANFRPILKSRPSSDKISDRRTGAISRYKPEHPLFTQGEYNAKSSQA